MAEKRKEPAFTVTDRRLFTEDGELRAEAHGEVREELRAPASSVLLDTAQQVTQESGQQSAKQSTAAATGSVAEFPAPSDVGAEQMPPPPTVAEQQAQADAYRESSKDLDSRVELSGQSAKEFEMTFERFLASLYMTAMLQLGLMHQQGEQPRVDILGARQTIDTLALLAQKTKGNLTPTEETFVQNSLYEARMAYVEVTNALARPPQPGAATGTGGR